MLNIYIPLLKKEFKKKFQFKEVLKVVVKASYTRDTLKFYVLGLIESNEESVKSSELKLSENSNLTEILKDNLLNNLKFDSIDFMAFDFDFKTKELQLFLKYIYKNDNKEFKNLIKL